MKPDNEKKTDDLLRELIRLDTEKEVDHYLKKSKDKPVEPCQEFEQRLQIAIGSELEKNGKRRSITRAVGRYLSKVAVAILALCIGIYMIAGKDRIRVWAEQAKQIIVRVFQTHTEIQYDTGAEASIDGVKRLSLSQLPEGFELEFEEIYDDSIAQYFCRKEQFIFFEVLPTNSSSLVIDSENAEFSLETIGNTEIRIYKKRDSITYHWLENNHAKTLQVVGITDIAESLFQTLFTE